MAVTGFTRSEKRIIQERDLQQCALCFGLATTVNHRANRGMGGRKSANTIANGCGICHTCNGLIESDPAYAAWARRLGVKISSHADPLRIPYRHPVEGWVLLDNEGGYRHCTEKGEPV